MIHTAGMDLSIILVTDIPYSTAKYESEGDLDKSYGPLVRYVKLVVVHAPGTFSPDPEMHHSTCHDGCRDRKLTVSFDVGCGENVPGITRACETRNFTYLVRGPWCKITPPYVVPIDGTPVSQRVWLYNMRSKPGITWQKNIHCQRKR